MFRPKAAYPSQAIGKNLRPTMEEAARLTPGKNICYLSCEPFSYSIASNCPSLFSVEIVNEFRKKQLRADGVVLAAVGIDHDIFVKQAERFFGGHVLPKAEGKAPVVAQPQVRL